MRLLSQDEDRLLHRTSAAGRVGACPIRSNDDNAARQTVNGEEDSTQDTAMGCRHGRSGPGVGGDSGCAGLAGLGSAVTQQAV